MIIPNPYWLPSDVAPASIVESMWRQVLVQAHLQLKDCRRWGPGGTVVVGGLMSWLWVNISNDQPIGCWGGVRKGRKMISQLVSW